jgi:hypothetical protein
MINHIAHWRHRHCHGNQVGGRGGADETGDMKSLSDPHYRHRFPAEVVSHTAWLYHVFSLSLRKSAIDLRCRQSRADTCQDGMTLNLWTANQVRNFPLLPAPKHLQHLVSV